MSGLHHHSSPSAGAAQDTSLVHVLLSLADGLLKMDHAMQAFMHHTSKRFDHIESRLDTYDQLQLHRHHSPTEDATTPGATTAQPHSSARAQPNSIHSFTPKNVQEFHVHRPVNELHAGDDLKQALNALTMKLSSLQNHRAESDHVPSSTTVSVAQTHTETEDLTSASTAQSASGFPVSGASTPSVAVTTTCSQASNRHMAASLWTPTNNSSKVSMPRRSPPPKAHSPAVRIVEERLEASPSRAPPPPRPFLEGRPQLSSQSRVMVSQPRTEVYLHRNPSVAARNEDVSVDALLHVAFKPTAYPTNPQMGVHAKAPVNHVDSTGGNSSFLVERWLSTLSSSDEERGHTDTFLVSRSTAA